MPKVTDAELIRDPYFDFALRPTDAEQLYRLMNLLTNVEGVDEHELNFILPFRDRLRDFVRKHPVKYGS